MNKSPGRGRRPGPSDTRDRILEVARRRFLAEGYQTVTMRSIAAEVGVDAALISHFFGSKSGLLGAALALPANPAKVLAGVLVGDLDTLPERVLRALIANWDDPAKGGPLRIMLDAAVHEPAVRSLVREMLEREIVDRIAQRIGGIDARARAGTFAVQLAGVIFSRYVLRIDPVASMTPDELVRRLVPGLRAALRGPAPERQSGGVRGTGLSRSRGSRA